MRILPNSCKCSEIKISPKNWKSPNASVLKRWRLHYRFYDACDKVKQVTLWDMNAFKTVKERRQICEQLIKNEYNLLDAGYNPILGKIQSDSEIGRFTPFIEALEYAKSKTICSHETAIDIKSVVRIVAQSANALSFDLLPIGEISRRHIKLIIEKCSQINPRWSAKRHNMYLAYLSKLFGELVEIEACDYNPCRDIKRQKQTKNLRRYITREELEKAIEHIERYDHRFALYIRLFFVSVSRKTEMQNLQPRDINLDTQLFKSMIRKGIMNRVIERTINNNAIELWKEAICEAGSDMYIWGRGLKPGKKPIRRDQINKRWRIYVKGTGKKSLKIPVDFNTIRHLALDEITAKLSMQAAAAQAGHTTTAMVAKVYAINQKTRDHLQLKELDLKIGS